MLTLELCLVSMGICIVENPNDAKTQSKSDLLFNTQSRVLLDIRLILEV